MILARMTMNTDLLVICVARVAGDREVLQQVDAVIFIISTYSSFQQSLPVIVIPATPKETAAISDLQTSFIQFYCFFVLFMFTKYYSIVFYLLLYYNVIV